MTEWYSSNCMLRYTDLSKLICRCEDEWTNTSILITFTAPFSIYCTCFPITTDQYHTHYKKTAWSSVMVQNSERIAEASTLVIICTVSVLGNTILFVIFSRKRALPTISNGFLLNLAFADLLVSVVNMPITVVTIIEQRWIFGETACKLLGFTTMLSFVSSVMSLAMIAMIWCILALWCLLHVFHAHVVFLWALGRFVCFILLYLKIHKGDKTASSSTQGKHKTRRNRDWKWQI